MNSTAAPSTTITSNSTQPFNSHDYYSEAIYYWPNPLFLSGYPYIAKHGQVNPTAAALPDKKNFQLMYNKVSQLAIYYFYSQQTKYAEAAINFVRVWFLNNDTAMNPNMDYAGVIPGSTTIRGEGIIEIHNIVFLLDYIELVKVSGLWTVDDEVRWVSWLKQYFIWLTTNPAAILEQTRTNNHGTFCDLQLLGISLYINNTNFAGQLVKSIQGRLDSQMAVDGSFPLETSQSNSFYQSVFNLQGFFALASLGQQFGQDLWHYDATGQSLENGLIFILNNYRNWPFPDINGPAPSQPKAMNILLQLVVKARGIYGAKYDPVLQVLSGGLTNVKHASQPVLQFYLTQVGFQPSKNEYYFTLAVMTYAAIFGFLLIFYFGLARICYKSADQIDMEKKFQALKKIESGNYNVGARRNNYVVQGSMVNGRPSTLSRAV